MACNHCDESTHEHGHHTSKENKKQELILTILGIIVFIVAIIINKNMNILSVYLYIISYVLIGYDIIILAVKKLFKRDMFDENFLMTIATIGAICIGEYPEAVAVLLFYKVGEYLQDLAVDTSKNKIKSALDIRPSIANLKTNKDIITVDPKQLKINDIIMVKTGEKVPVDGVVLSEIANINMSALTGESMPKDIYINEEILSGAINLGGVIQVRVTKTYDNSTIAKIIDLIQNAISKKSNTEKFITRFSKIYTPVVIAIAAILMLVLPLVYGISFVEGLSRALIFLVISCPCALVISVPLGFFIGIGTSSKNGILIKGSNYLDMLNKVDTIVFDKTGTITTGKFEVNMIKTLGKYAENEIFEYIALAESYSNHYLAKSILNRYDKQIDKDRILNHEELAGYGIKAVIDNKNILIGNNKLIESNNISFDKLEINGTVIYLSIDNKVEGYIVLKDVLKENANTLISSLKRLGIKKTVLLTGDDKTIADEVGGKIGIDEIYSNLLPQDKVNILNEIKSNMDSKRKIAYIGDGINDGPAMATSDIGISMGNGSDIAIETSDIVLITDELSKLIECINIASKTKKVIIQNIILILIVKAIFLILSALGLSSMWYAVFADIGISLIAILNSMRIFKY